MKLKTLLFGKNISIVKKNYFFNVFYQVLNVIIPLITVPYASRVFGADGIGIQSYTASLAAYFAMFAALGTNSYGQREIARCRDDKEKMSRVFWEIEFLCIITTLFVIVIWCLFLGFIKEYKSFFIVQTFSLIAAGFDITWLYSGLEEFGKIVIRSSIVRIAAMVFLLCFVREKDDLLIYTAVLSVTILLGNISLWWEVPKLLYAPKIRQLRIFSHFINTLSYFIPAIAISVYTVLDKVMIHFLAADINQNGYYEQTTTIVKMVLTVITSLNVALFARMSYLFSKERYNEIKKNIEFSMDFSLFMGIPFVLGLCGISGNFVPWFFGEGYNEVVSLMYVYSWLIIPIAVSNCLDRQYLTPSGQIARSSKAIIAGAVINFMLNLFLIPRFQALGAAAASVAAEIVIAVLFMHMSRDCISWKNIFKMSYKKAAAGTIMFLAVLLIGRNKEGSFIITLIQIISGAAVYALVLIVLKDEFLMDKLKEW